ncbi:MAG: hypothetical protein JNJ83_24375 [Verrucomicrobiaceae bacterium]|nr:hypothetical protein [Verrucomicrobiaceae bacterium]
MREGTLERVVMYSARHAASYIMDTFPFVKRQDETKHDHYHSPNPIRPHRSDGDRPTLTDPPASTACRSSLLPSAQELALISSVIDGVA